MKLHNPFDDPINTSVSMILSIYLLAATCAAVFIYAIIYWTALILWLIPISAAVRVVYYIFKGK